ncbi:uncharacterized protein LOC114533393 isoform X3 [Dendronephthya gigantea]|uniref:uncharacterized protein LOC114533393 isoform X3 n=1 Tax=Dendronephthya gigantea TaxID=151771 RepID=UPI00106D2431|nr:uncharacterized protein LOC114533393 isoform X3 [Dendronephthya gigantea]
MLVVPSVSQFLSYYRVTLPDGPRHRDAITIAIQDKDVDGLYMNGMKLDGLKWNPIGGTRYVWTVISLTHPRIFTVYHASTEVKFGLLAFVWKAQATYIYPGGFGLHNNSNGTAMDTFPSRVPTPQSRFMHLHTWLSRVPSYQSRFMRISNNYGKHFIVGFTALYDNEQDDYIGVTILAPFDTIVTFFSNQSGNLWNETVYVEGGKHFEHKLPMKLRMNEKLGHLQKGIEISSTRYISLMCRNRNNYAADGYLVFPTRALGLIYVVASHLPYYTKANIAVISAHDNNTILVFLKKNAVIEYRGLTFDKNRPLLNILLKLERHEALYISASSDLSGSVVIATKPVMVISSVGYWQRFKFLESSLLPVSLWGHRYILTSAGRMNKGGDTFRIFAYENNTAVKTAKWTKVLSSATYAELILGHDYASYVNCSKPCQVVQYIEQRSVDGKLANSAMLVVPSVSQFLSYYRVTLPDGPRHRDAITIAIQDKDVDGLYMNGMKLDGLKWNPIGGTRYVWTVISLTHPRIFTVYHASTEIKFGLLVFVWKAQATYIYPGGFGLHNNSNDINECESGTNYTCQKGASCISTDGSFNCVCNIGYTYNGVTCADIDECTFKHDVCGNSRICLNNPGSYSCGCPNGYTGDGVVCNDINECKLGTDSCEKGAECINVNGSFICVCSNGYIRDGSTCKDINECKIETDSCEKGSECFNTNGSFICVCSIGYIRDGSTCKGIKFATQ